ncbi:MAG: hypothetical protein ACTSWA_08730 [Candidatus Thorarchaeota archaeon]
MSIKLPPREDFYDAVNDAIHELEKILEIFNPLEIIASISKHVSTLSSQDHSESEDMLWFPLIEYLMSLSLTKPLPTTPKSADKATIEKVILLWKQLKNNFSAFYGSEYVSKDGSVEAQIRFKLILEYFGIRGKSYPPHLKKTFLELFKPHNSHLASTLGFSADDFNDFIHHIETEITKALREEQKKCAAIIELHSRFREWEKDKEIIGKPSDVVMKRFIEDNPDLRKQQDQVNELAKIRPYNGFEIKSGSPIHERILKSISCSFGDNKTFLEPKKWRGWPTNNTILSERPVIKVENEYYALSYATLAWNRIEIVESLIEQCSPDYYQDHYLPARDQYVEKVTLNLLQDVLPDSSIYSNLYYYIEEDQIRKQVELDGLVIFDDCLLLVESKAGILPLPARRGSIIGLKSKVEEILKKGHSQATRALDYIQSSAQVSFFDKNDSVIVTIDRERFQHHYLILSTFEPLFVLSTHLSSAKKMGLLIEGTWPWAVFINDLRVIVDILSHPTIFLHYLNRRIKLNDQPAVETYDELDYLLHYVHTGLYFSENETERHDSIVIVPSTTALDEYYNNPTNAGIKPIVKMDPTFELLINRLEDEKPVHFTSACFHLLDCDEETRSEISKQLRNCEERFNVDKNVKSISFRINGTGLLLGCLNDIDNQEEFAKRWAEKWFNEMDVKYVTIIIWTPPVESGPFRVFQFQKTE